MVEIAEKEGATGFAHGCTGKGNDQVRFDVSVGALAPELKIIAPVREWNMTRDEEIEYAKKNGIPVTSAAKKYSIDQASGAEASSAASSKTLAKSHQKMRLNGQLRLRKLQTSPNTVTIRFEKGVPVALNGKKLPPLKLIEQLNKTAGKHGVGRIDHIEDRLIGLKSRENYECPAANVILEAHKDLEKMVLTRHEVLFKQQIDAQWTFMVYAGLWVDPLREDLEAFINKTQENVTGEVRVKLFKGGLQIVGRSSPMSLYDQNLVNYNIKTGFNQAYSKGFIELWGLQTRMANILKRKAKEKK